MNRKLTHAVAFFLLFFSGAYAVKPDTLTLTRYLELFDTPFTTEYNLGWFHDGHNHKMTFSFDRDRQLDSRRIRLDHGHVMSPDISGWAYSYRKLNDHLFWLICYVEGESGTSVMLYVLDTGNRTFSKPYRLANAFGDQGDWAYRYGSFENDSTYNYLLVYGDQEKTTVSISGQDRIRPDGAFIEIRRQGLLK